MFFVYIHNFKYFIIVNYKIKYSEILIISQQFKQTSAY